MSEKLNDTGVGVFARQHSAATGGGKTRPRLLTWREKAGREEGEPDGYVFGDLSASIFRLFQCAASLFCNRPTLLLGVIEAEGLPANVSSSNFYVTVVPLSYKGKELHEEKWYSGVYENASDGCPKWDEVTCIGQRRVLNEVSSVVIKVKSRRGWPLRATSVGEIRLPMSVWWEDQCTDTWIDVSPRKGQKTPCTGRLRLRLQRFGWEEKVKVDPEKMLRRFSMLSPLLLVEAVCLKGVASTLASANPVLTLVLLDENGEEVKGTKVYSTVVSKTTKLNSFRLERMLTTANSIESGDGEDDDDGSVKASFRGGENIHVYEQVFVFGDASDLFNARTLLIKVKDESKKSILNFKQAGNLGEIRIPLEELIENGDRKQSAAFYGITPRLNRRAHVETKGELLLRWYVQGSMQIKASLSRLLRLGSESKDAPLPSSPPPSTRTSDVCIAADTADFLDIPSVEKRVAKAKHTSALARAVKTLEKEIAKSDDGSSRMLEEIASSSRSLGRITSIKSTTSSITPSYLEWVDNRRSMVLGIEGEDSILDESPGSVNVDANYAAALRSLSARVPSDEDVSEGEDYADGVGETEAGEGQCARAADESNAVAIAATSAEHRSFETAPEKLTAEITERFERDDGDSESAKKHVGIEAFQSHLRGFLARRWFTAQKARAADATGVNAETELGRKLLVRYMRTHNQSLFSFPPPHIITAELTDEEVGASVEEGEAGAKPPASHTQFSWRLPKDCRCIDSMLACGHTKFSISYSNVDDLGPVRLARSLSKDAVLKRWPQKYAKRKLSSRRPPPLSPRLVDLTGTDPSPSLLSPKKYVSPKNISAGNAAFKKHRPASPISPKYVTLNGADPVPSLSPANAATKVPNFSTQIAESGEAFARASSEGNDEKPRGRFKKPARLRGSQVDLSGADSVPTMGSSFRETSIEFSARLCSDDSIEGTDFQKRANAHKSMPNTFSNASVEKRAVRETYATSKRLGHANSADSRRSSPLGRPPKPKESSALPAPPPPDLPTPPPPPLSHSSSEGVTLEDQDALGEDIARGEAQDSILADIPEDAQPSPPVSVADPGVTPPEVREVMFFRLMREKAERAKEEEQKRHQDRLNAMSPEDREEEDRRAKDAEKHNILKGRMIRAHLGRGSVTRKRSILKGRRRSSKKK